jgi:hypothetical protein
MPSRLTRHLRWDAAGPNPPLQRLAPPLVNLVLAPRDETTFLLNIGAEIEHALLVQYLYAAYSLDGAGLDAARRAQIEQWRATIVEIAREEMAHLLTVQNLLTAIGSPPCFERGDFPLDSGLLPFPFELQRLTKTSLAKYVLAEMPDEDTIDKRHLGPTIEEIKRRAGAPDGETVQRVGRVYHRVSDLVDPSGESATYADAVLASSALEALSVRRQGHPDEWGLGYKDLLVLTAGDRTTMAAAIKAIDAQGEGSKPGEHSHFERFLDIYRAFPEDDGWQATRNVADNPSTDPAAPADRLILGDAARAWADLSNLRYRMLLTALAHAYRMERPADVTTRTPRGLLVSWTFGEMYNLRTIAGVLMTLPLRPTSDRLAGPPFEMPYSLVLPDRDRDCWRLHMDLLHASQRCTATLRRLAGPEHQPYLAGLSAADARALAQVETVIGG